MKAVLFDIDNTLLIRKPSIPEKWHEEIVHSGHIITLDDAERAFAECEMWVEHQTRLENETGIRMNDDEFKKGVINCCLNSLGAPESVSDIIANIWIGRYEKHYELSPGAAECLDELCRRGIKTGIVSNNYSSIRAVLRDTGIDAFFSTIIISDEVKMYKPDPKILLYACEQLGVHPGDVLYVGDHPFDIICSNEAGVNSAWIPVNKYMKLPDGAKPPLMLLGSLCELCSQLK